MDGGIFALAKADDELHEVDDSCLKLRSTQDGDAGNTCTVLSYPDKDVIVLFPFPLFKYGVAIHACEGVVASFHPVYFFGVDAQFLVSGCHVDFQADRHFALFKGGKRHANALVTISDVRVLECIL